MPDTYDPAFFERLFAVEDAHFWFRTRNDIIRTVVQQVLTTLPPDARVLEVGCGTGNVLRVLEEIVGPERVIGLDQSEEGLALARRRTACTLVAGDVRDPLTFDRRFHLIGCFDVLEHIPDDGEVLSALYGHLERGGTLIVTVPAHQSLWSYFDEASHHSRRYEAGELQDKLALAGFDVEYVTEYMSTTAPLVWLGRRASALVEKIRGSRTSSYDMSLRELRVVPLVNDLLRAACSWEPRAVGRRMKLPPGTSLLAVARRS